MTIEISKMDWGVPCKDVWTAITEDDAKYCGKSVNDMFFQELEDSLDLCIRADDKEFLGYNIYIDGEYTGTVYEYLNHLLRTKPDCILAKLFKTAIADECDYSPMFSDEYDTEYSQYRREMQERLFE